MRKADGIGVVLTERKKVTSTGIQRLRELHDRLKKICLHIDAQGNRTMSPIGGGMSKCWICDGEMKG
jgi:hypothetical protein